MSRSLPLLLALIALSAPVPAEEPEPAAGDCADAAALAVQKRYEGVRDISARFEQRNWSAQGGAEALSRGEVVLAKPGRMRWSYEEPEPSLIVSDGETMWLYDATLGEAQKLPAVAGSFDAAAARFLLGAGDMRRDFQVRADSCGKDEARLELTPREPASYEKLFLVVDPDSGDVRSTQVIDLLGNTASVSFRDLRLDTDPPDATFRFEPPPGVEVTELKP